MTVKKARKAAHDRKKGENAENRIDDDALSWYFNRSVHEPLDRILEVEDCVQKEFYTNEPNSLQIGHRYNFFLTLIIYDSFIYDSSFIAHRS